MNISYLDISNPDAELEPFTLALTADEAVVLFELLTRADDAGTFTGLEAAEERVLWTLEAQLEKSLVTPFRANYAEVVAAARSRVLGQTTEGSSPSL